MENDVILTTKSLSTVFVYYGTSFFVACFLFFGKFIINKMKIYPLFLVFMILVPIFASIQFCIFYYGSSFIRKVFSITTNIDGYDSIMWGALFFTIFYLFAMPVNNYYKK